jgi:hypothetical protein
MAKQMIDYGVDGNNDLKIGAGGDFVRVESTAQHQEQLILCGKGDYKQNPTICVDAFGYIDGEDFNDFIGEVSAQFQQDGMDVKQVALQPNGVIEADAYYK